MIQVTPQMRIMVAVEPVDFRKGIDGLAQVCKQELRADPFSGTLFVFCNRDRTAIRVLVYDSQGFWMCHKRLSHGRFRHWPKGGGEDGNLAAHALLTHELQVLLMAGDPAAARALPAWRQLGQQA